MEANVPQSNKPVTPSAQDVALPAVGNQLKYPFDYETQRALDEYFGFNRREAFPIGSIFISAVTTSPEILLGYGTWVVKADGYAIVGLKAGDPDFGTINTTLGNRTELLETRHLPSHSHDNTTFENLGGLGGSGFTSGPFYETGASQVEGGDEAHNNIQPSIVLAIWERTA